MAFYRVDNKYLIKVETNLFGPGFDLLAQNYDTYSYPVEGWYWFDTDEDASKNLGFTLKPIEESLSPINRSVVSI